MTNGVIHFEISSNMAPTLHAFYADVFGWKIDASNPMNYGLVDTQAGGCSGGIGPSQDGTNGVTWYIGVADTDDALKAVEDNGGKTVMPTTEVMGGQVTIALFADPQGNVVGVVKDDPSRPTAEIMSTKGSGLFPVEHAELLGTDFAPLRTFYANTFGWKLQDAGEGYAVWGPEDGRGIGGGVGVTTGEPVVLFYISTDDVAGTLERVKAKGGSVVREPETIPGMVEFAAFGDPEGNLVGLARSLS